MSTFMGWSFQERAGWVLGDDLVFLNAFPMTTNTSKQPIRINVFLPSSSQRPYGHAAHPTGKDTPTAKSDMGGTVGAHRTGRLWRRMFPRQGEPLSRCHLWDRIPRIAALEKSASRSRTSGCILYGGLACRLAATRLKHWRFA